jgi:zinc protease
MLSSPRFSPYRAVSAAVIWFLILAWAASAGAGITANVKTETLPNGLKVLVLENHKAPVATLSVFYKVGSRNEQVGKTGISHLCEHLMFRGTKTLGPEQFSKIIQENGGTDNAFTTADFTDYFEIINARNLDVPIKLEADRMANFDPRGFNAEKAVVMEERRLRTEDNPEDALHEITKAQAYVEYPYHWPVIGWMSDIRHLTLKDALAYHAMYYSPRNSIVVAVGDFNAAEVLKQISEAFGSIKNGPEPPPFTQTEQEQKGQRRVMLEHAANLPAFDISYHVPNLRSPDAWAIEIAGEILGDGKSSRLYRDLVINKQMVVDVSVDYDMTSFGPPLFTVSAQMRPGIKAKDVIAEVEKQLAELRDKPVSAEELQKAKNLEQAEFVFGEDSIFQQAMLLGVYQMLGDYRMVDQYIPNIDKVTAADVQRVARRYFVKSNRTVGILVPTGLLPHEAAGGKQGMVR